MLSVSKKIKNRDVMPKSKLLEGYLEYLKNSDDPNLKKCREEYGENAIFHSIAAWKNEMRTEDVGAIPSKELISEMKRKSANP